MMSHEEPTFASVRTNFRPQIRTKSFKFSIRILLIYRQKMAEKTYKKTDIRKNGLFVYKKAVKTVILQRLRSTVSGIFRHAQESAEKAIIFWTFEPSAAILVTAREIRRLFPHRQRSITAAERLGKRACKRMKERRSQRWSD